MKINLDNMDEVVARNNLRKILFTTNPTARVVSAAAFFKGESFYVSAYARCHPDDKFDYIIGMKIALSRLMKALNLSKESRRKIWKLFLEENNIFEKMFFREEE